MAGTEHALEVGRVGKAWVVVQVGVLCIDLRMRETTRSAARVGNGRKVTRKAGIACNLRRVLSREVGKGVEARLMARVIDANVLATHHLCQTVVVRVLVQRAHRSLQAPTQAMGV